MSISKSLFKSQYAASIAGCVLIAALAGCSSKSGDSTGKQVNDFVQGGTVQMTDKVQPVKGFLPKPELLKPGTEGQMALVYRDQSVNSKKYSSVMLDPVTIWQGSSSALQSVPEDQRLDLVNTFHSDLFTALSAHCKMVTKPAAGTLRLRFAITDGQSSDAAASTVATYAPFVAAAYNVASRNFNKGVAYFAGNATVEGFATDGKTGGLIWEGVDKRGGTVAVVANTLDSWLDVHRAFQDWSDLIVAKLQKAGVCQASAE